MNNPFGILFRGVTNLLKQFNNIQVMPVRGKKYSGNLPTLTYTLNKYKGPKVKPGDRIGAKEMMHKQLKLEYFPGMNTRIKMHRLKNIYALKHGKVVITTEKAKNLDWDNYIIDYEYGRFDKTAPLYKKHYHVIPDPPHFRFKLVDQV